MVCAIIPPFSSLFSWSSCWSSPYDWLDALYPVWALLIVFLVTVIAHHRRRALLEGVGIGVEDQVVHGLSRLAERSEQAGGVVRVEDGHRHDDGAAGVGGAAGDERGSDLPAGR
ncbi:hypothetical protein [Streptomyces sp. NPDC006270]|uniref:hypothetical protein n=1 Tax=Streptomyces sp. NPDC006270 TaxID=3364741 RepID=UPI00368C5088